MSERRVSDERLVKVIGYCDSPERSEFNNIVLDLRDERALTRELVAALSLALAATEADCALDGERPFPRRCRTCRRMAEAKRTGSKRNTQPILSA